MEKALVCVWHENKKLAYRVLLTFTTTFGLDSGQILNS